MNALNSPTPTPRSGVTGGCDLHVHSHYSDGSHSPGEILEMARETGLSAVGLTDHDTMEGLPEWLEQAASTSVEAIPGLEISCKAGDLEVHILGYFVQPDYDPLLERLQYFRASRAQRVRGMVEVLREEESVEITFEEIADNVESSLLGKPHVAQTLVNKGVVGSIRAAFREYLGEGLLLDRVPKERMDAGEAVELIKAAGGVPVLAHPVFYEPELDLKLFKRMGIVGLETFYPEHDERERKRYRRLARKHDLLITGGSDFHGRANPSVQLGDLRLPERYLQALKEARCSLDSS